MKKKLIRMTENDLHSIIKESVNKIIKESYEDDEESAYEMGLLNKALQKEKGTYHATSQDGKFQTGDKVIVHTKKRGDIEGVIDDFDTHLMTWEEVADVKYFDKERGKEMTMMSVPLKCLEKIG